MTLSILRGTKHEKSLTVVSSTFRINEPLAGHWQVLLTIACNAHELATRAADNARLDMQASLEEVAKAEKIIRR